MSLNFPTQNNAGESSGNFVGESDYDYTNAQQRLAKSDETGEYPAINEAELEGYDDEIEAEIQRAMQTLANTQPVIKTHQRGARLKQGDIPTDEYSLTELEEEIDNVDRYYRDLFKVKGMTIHHEIAYNALYEKLKLSGPDLLVNEIRRLKDNNAKPLVIDTLKLLNSALNNDAFKHLIISSRADMQSGYGDYFGMIVNHLREKGCSDEKLPHILKAIVTGLGNWGKLQIES